MLALANIDSQDSIFHIFSICSTAFPILKIITIEILRADTTVCMYIKCHLYATSSTSLMVAAKNSFDNIAQVTNFENNAPQQ